jgi:nucleotide-binding universal stress UspA family protein
MKRMMVVTDGSPAGDAAVGWAGAVALAVGAELQVAVPEGVDPESVAMPSGRMAVPVPAGGWAEVEELVDAVVAGADGSRWFPALHLDHRVHELVTHARVPLVVVPPDASAETRRLVVGADGTRGSRAAVDWVGAVGAAFGAEVVVVYARPAPLTDRIAGGRPDAGSDLSVWVAPLVAAGLDPQVREIEGDPVTALCRVAGEAPGSVIVVGGRQVDAHRPYAIGSVGLRILDHADVPVVVVPPER